MVTAIKILVLLVLVLDSTVSHAFEYDSPYTQAILQPFKPGDCIGINHFSEFEIVSQVEPGIYQIAVRHGGRIHMQGFIETTKTKFEGPGRIHKMFYVTYVASKELPLENGFTGKFGFWKECSK